MRNLNYIAIEGPIGVGKTSLAKLLSKRLSAKLVLEKFEDNPFLSEFYENINLFPSQPLLKVGEDEIFIKDDNLYNSNIVYPESNYNVNRMSMRGYELLNIEVIPFEYNPSNKELKIYNNIEIIVTESENRNRK